MCKRIRTKGKKKDNNLIAILIIFIVILIYFISLGKFSLNKRNKILKIDGKLLDLYFEAESKENLKKKLERKVKIFFFAVKTFILLTYIVFNILLFHYRFNHYGNFDDTLSVLLNYNQLLFLSIAIMNLFFSKNPFNLKFFIKRIHLWVKYIVFRNHPLLEEEINNVKNKIQELEKERRSQIED